MASARRPITRNTVETSTTPTKTVSRYGISSARLSGGSISTPALIPTLRCAVLHPFALAFYSAKDFYHYLRRKGYNR